MLAVPVSLPVMRLEKIKLAGFKSFVDPTTVPFPSNLVGIVGPNGCGKSNVIDAVRWVMGESSAKMLRGDSMADVIFNGSSTRKPVGTASIELLFDNADGTAGGEYAAYSQISVKRQVSRDGQSTYVLNGTKCRRRDIADLFLGTGLGPRSYSIIEQGMISRIIEARPEDLRAYLEEAAGISKYKERRKETERRIEHARDNLSRLNDLRDEVQKQLRHLERQAAVAERYQLRKQEERAVKAELVCLRLADMDGEIHERERRIAEQENHLQSAVAEQRGLEAAIEKKRSDLVEANDTFNTTQGQFYAVGAQIARFEEAIQFARETLRRQEDDLQQTDRALAQAREHSAHDEGALARLVDALSADRPLLDAASASATQASGALAKAEAAMQSWQSEWEEFNLRATEPAQTAQVERARINQLEQQEGVWNRRLEKLREDKRRLADVELEAEINELQRQEGQREREVVDLQQSAARAAEVIASAREANRELQDDLAQAREQVEGLKGRMASLQALQQAAVGSDDQIMQTWLGEQGLADARRLLEILAVPVEWQRTVEVVLGHHLQALCVDNLAACGSLVDGFTGGRLDLFDVSGEPDPGRPGSLGALLVGPPRLIELLNRVNTAASLNEALERAATLGEGETVVTPDGVWLGPGWLHVQHEDGAQGGVLAREQALRETAEELASIQARAGALARRYETGQVSLADAERRRDEAQQGLDVANRQLADLRAQLSGKRARAEQICHRIEALEVDEQDLLAQLHAGRETVEQARVKLHQALGLIEELGNRREALVQRRDLLKRDLDQARQTDFEARSAAHELALRVESMRSSEQSLRSGMDRARFQVGQLDERCSGIRAAIEASREPLRMQQAELEQKLQERVRVESRLQGVRQHLETIDQQVRELEQQRHGVEQRVQEERAKLDQQRMNRQELIVRGRTLEEQLAEMGEERSTVVDRLPKEASVSEWESRLERLGAQIQRLGPINLAAIDEFKEQSERMEYLERQHADIFESLATLEDAIRKIDRETRTRFKETFDKVNNGLQELFPKLFGGGHAYLELTGEDLLDTGVTVMARPPGKRNSSIHLLSGGEKAMSAVALVFAIFQLNPAPFCMLDEVDAPLDDANVGRYCSMVKEMAEQVQFIFITHNKLTMEIANQLTGVTMHEPGVSRLVSVDIDEAAALAAV